MSLSDHKTKITGAILAAISVIQANSEILQGILSPKAFAWVTTFIGALVTALGFANSSNASNSSPSTSPPPAGASK